MNNKYDLCGGASAMNKHRSIYSYLGYYLGFPILLCIWKLNIISVSWCTSATSFHPHLWTYSLWFYHFFNPLSACGLRYISSRISLLSYVLDLFYLLIFDLPNVMVFIVLYCLLKGVCRPPNCKVVYICIICILVWGK